MRWAAFAAALCAAVAAVLLLTYEREGDSKKLPPAPAPEPSAKRAPWQTPQPELHAAPGDAALWLRRQWLHADPTPDELAELTRALEAAGVHRVYPFLGPMDAAGKPGWRSLGAQTPWAPEHARAFLSAVRTALPWTGGVAGRDVHWADAAQREGFVTEVKSLIALGAAGVHVNIEPVPDGDPGFVQLLTAVKQAIGDHELSAAVVAPKNARITVAAERYWSLDYLKEVCGPADEIVVMGYDTWLDDRETYQRVVADWTEQLARDLPADCAWRMGVPTYDDEAPHHKLDVERVDVALRGVREGLARLGAEPPPSFRGVALYASWTTDAQEWAAYDALWRALPPTARVIPEPVR